MRKTLIQMETARSLLAFVFAEARETLERSPEQVGSSLGMSGRTIRRLESADDEQRPRRATLQTLASFYGLDARFVTELGDWEALGGAELSERLCELVGEEREPEDELALRTLALRLARGAGARAAASGVMQLAPGMPGAEDVPTLVEAFSRLDRRRQRLALTLLDELVAAREHERLTADG